MDSNNTMEYRIGLEKQNKRNDQVTELILDNCRASQISGLTDEFVNLEILSLINVGLVTLKGFPKLPKLKKLELSDNRLTGGLNHLHSSPKLQHLNISGNKIKEFDALEPLKEFQELVNLDLYNCEVTKSDDYRKKVFDLLPKLHSLDGYDRNEIEVADSDESEDEGSDLENRITRDDNDLDDEEDDDDDGDGDDGEGENDDEVDDDDDDEVSASYDEGGEDNGVEVSYEVDVDDEEGDDDDDDDEEVDEEDDEDEDDQDEIYIASESEGVATPDDHKDTGAEESLNTSRDVTSDGSLGKIETIGDEDDDDEEDDEEDGSDLKQLERDFGDEEDGDDKDFEPSHEQDDRDFEIDPEDDADDEESSACLSSSNMDSLEAGSRGQKRKFDDEGGDVESN